MIMKMIIIIMMRIVIIMILVVIILTVTISDNNTDHDNDNDNDNDDKALASCCRPHADMISQHSILYHSIAYSITPYIIYGIAHIIYDSVAQHTTPYIIYGIAHTIHHTVAQHTMPHRAGLRGARLRVPREAPHRHGRLHGARGAISGSRSLKQT